VAGVGVGPIESIPREVSRVRIGSMKSVAREVCSVSARANASVAEPVDAGETVGRGPTGVTEIRATPTKPLRLSRSSCRNCETHAKDRQCCVLSSIQHGLISCGTPSAFELLAGQRRNGMNVCSLVGLEGLAGMTQHRAAPAFAAFAALSLLRLIMRPALTPSSGAVHHCPRP